MEKMTPVLLVLCSGFFHLTLHASNRLRFFEDITQPEFTNWTDAKNICKEMNGDLVTLYDDEDASTITQLVLSNYGSEKKIWLGLQKSLGNVSTWSDGVPVTFNRSRVQVPNGEQMCEAINSNTWEGFDCSDRKPFMCYRGSEYILIEKETKNWCEAQDHCRKHFTDLVSIRNEMQNDEVIKKGKDKIFWIGLMHDEWKWEDQACSTYRKWSDISNEALRLDYKCSQLQTKQLHKQMCTNTFSVLCSKGTVRIRVIRENLTWEQAYDYCKDHHSRLLQIEDAQEQDAVKQWLNHSTLMMDDAYWIALRQSRVFGFWIWSDKTVAWNNWKNNKIPEMPMSDNCGVIQTGNYTWRDENCWHPHPFLCEEDISYMKKKKPGLTN